MSTGYEQGRYDQTEPLGWLRSKGNSTTHVLGRLAALASHNLTELVLAYVAKECWANGNRSTVCFRGYFVLLCYA